MTRAVLDAAERQLEARFADLAAMRRPLGYPVYALEHGLTAEEIEALGGAASTELWHVGLQRTHWRVWTALAAEAGYRYAGEEYWPSLERRPGEWRGNDLRNRLRQWFRQFHTSFGGSVPKGRWAAKFNIIAWPINNAILPRYLQDHFARHLHDLRYEFAHRVQTGAADVGQFLLDRYDGPASSRFGYFLQQTDLTTAIVLALREEEDATAVPRISPAVLSRIVGDLEVKRLARDYLREARAVLRTRSFSVGVGLRSGGANPTMERGAAAPILGPRLAAKLVPGEGLAIAMILPDFVAAFARAGTDAAALHGVRVRFAGAAERWAPASNLLTLAGQERRLAAFPAAAAPLVELQGASQPLHTVLGPLSHLEERPCWVLRRFNDGLYRQVVQGHVRARQSYLILSRTPLDEDDVASAGLTPLPTTMTDLSAYRLSTSDRLTDGQAATLKRLSIGTKASVTVEPAGLAPRPATADKVATWLTTEAMVLQLQADHEVAGFIVRLDGAEPVRIAAQSTETLIALDPVSIGRHQLKLAAIATAPATGGDVITTAQFVFDVAAPRPWPEAVRDKAGFRLIVSPANADLEEVLAGRALLAVIGPAGRQVQWALDTFDASGNRATTSKGTTTGTRASGRDIAQVIARLRASNSEPIDVAHRVDICAAIDELGEQALRFPHNVEPLRWTFDTSEQRVRLIDETAHEEPIQVIGLPLASPLERQPFDPDMVIEGYRVESPGMLFTARYRGRNQTAFISVPARETFHSFAELQLAQQIGLPADSAEALLLLIRTLALWSRARPLGHFAIVRKGTTMNRLRDALAVLACGGDFMRLINDGRPWALQAAREMVGGSPGFRSRMCSHAWSDSVREATEAFAGFARTYKVEENASYAAGAIELAHDPLRLRIGYGPEAKAKACRFLANRTLLRGAFLARAHAMAARAGLVQAVGQ